MALATWLRAARAARASKRWPTGLFVIAYIMLQSIEAMAN